MYVVSYKERELKDVEMDGVQKVTVRWLIGKQTGARTYAMRLFEIAPGGIIPLHNHEEEHEIFVLNGKAKLLGNIEGIAKKDDIVYVPSNELHGYDNTEGKEVFKFICVIPLIEKENA
ncbi:MAG: cupin domain-containing protein [Candidatus Thorarchaeota archaeon]|nr:cupin domain-containing protein [Candidatus Thorarchaeota archaeon]